MKKRYLVYGSLFAMLILITSCFEEDDKYATKKLAAGDIVFSIPDKALTAPPTGQTQLTQPDLNVVSGRFATTDDLKMTIGLTSGLTNLTIKTIATSNGATTDKATFTGVNGSVDWTYPINTLDIGNKAPAAGTAVTLVFTASSADNSVSTTRAFTVNVLDPFTLTSTNPTTAYADSTVSLAYSVPASTSLANVTKVEWFAKRSKKGSETSISSKAYAATTITDKFSYKMPSEIGGQDLTKLDTIYLRAVATYETGRTVTKSSTIRLISVPLSKTTSGLALYNPAVTGANASKVGYDFSKLAFNKTTDGEAIKDLKLVVTGSNIGFIAGVGNGTSFVKSTSAIYAPATTAAPLSFQSIRNAFNAGTPVTIVNSVYVNDVYIAMIDGGTGSSQYVIFKVTAVNLTPDTDNTDNIVFEVKSK